MAIEIRQLKDKRTNTPFFPITHWEAISDKPDLTRHYKGLFNASNGNISGGNTTLTSVAEEIGDMYVVGTAGTYAAEALKVGDSIIFTSAVAAGTAPTAANFIINKGTTELPSSNVTGSGIEGNLPIWTGEHTIGDSEISIASGTLENNADTIPTSLAVYNAISPLTDERIKYYDTWDLNKVEEEDPSESYKEARSSKILRIVNGNRVPKNVITYETSGYDIDGYSESDFPIIVRINTGSNCQKVHITHVNGIRLTDNNSNPISVDMWATQSYFIGTNKFSNKFEIINITKALTPLPDFRIKLDTSDIKVISQQIDQAEYSRTEYRVVFWRYDKMSNKLKMYNNDFSKTHLNDTYIEITPILFSTYDNNIINTKTLLLRGFESTYLCQDDEIDDYLEWEDIDTFENALSEEFVNGRLNTKFFGHPVQLIRINYRNNSDELSYKNNTNRFSTKIGVSVARCLIDDDGYVVKIIENSEIQYFYASIWALYQYDSEDDDYKWKFEYTAQLTRRPPYKGRTQYSDILSLF